MCHEQCALNHEATESAPIVSGVINKPTTVELCISPVYRRLAVAKVSIALAVAEILHGVQNFRTGYLTLTTPLSGKIFLRQGGTCYGNLMYQIRSL